MDQVAQEGFNLMTGRKPDCASRSIAFLSLSLLDKERILTIGRLSANGSNNLLAAADEHCQAILSHNLPSGFFWSHGGCQVNGPKVAKFLDR